MTSSTFFPETNSTSDIFHPQYTRRQRRRRRRRRKLPNTSQALADKKTSSRLEGSRRTTRTKFHYDQRSPSPGATIGHCSLRPQQERSNSLKGAAARFLWVASANLGGQLATCEHRILWQRLNVARHQKTILSPFLSLSTPNFLKIGLIWIIKGALR